MQALSNQSLPLELKQELWEQARARRTQGQPRPGRLVLACPELLSMGPRPEWDDALWGWVPTAQAAQAELVEVVRWAVQGLGVRQVLCVEHSQAGASLVARAEPARGYARLVAGAARVQAMSQAARERVRAQVALLGEDALLGEALEAGRLELSGLVYLAESGVWLLHEAGTEDFVPLGPEFPRARNLQ